jgi:trigger factor
LVDQISSDHKFNASKEQIDIKLNEMAVTYGEEAQQLLDYYKADPSRLAAYLLVVLQSYSLLIMHQINRLYFD